MRYALAQSDPLWNVLRFNANRAVACNGLGVLCTARSLRAFFNYVLSVVLLSVIFAALMLDHCKASALIFSGCRLQTQLTRHWRVLLQDNKT